jgi:hypothetical protein
MPTAAERYNFADVERDGKFFTTEMFKLCKVHEMNSITAESLTKIGTKDVLAKCLANALQLMDRQHNFAINLRVHMSSYQQDIIKLQSDVIDAQAKALQITERISSSISKTVEQSVESGFQKSYKDAFSAENIPSSTIISQATIKSVAKQLVIEEELSRNIMVFGLPEEENEDICKNVGNVFEELGEKPKVQATRLGKKKSVARPVKVTFSSATTVKQILMNSKKLRQIEKYKNVFLSPDRTIDQRVQHRELVQQLKDKTKEEPLRYHYIKGGLICSTDSDKTQTTRE